MIEKHPGPAGSPQIRWRRDNRDQGKIRDQQRALGHRRLDRRRTVDQDVIVIGEVFLDLTVELGAGCGEAGHSGREWLVIRCRGSPSRRSGLSVCIHDQNAAMLGEGAG